MLPRRLRPSEAVAIAQATFGDRDWPWIEPVRVVTGARTIMVTTDCHYPRNAGVVWINRSDRQLGAAYWIGDISAHQRGPIDAR